MEMTRTLILDAAIQMIEHASVGELTVRAAAKQANISERTVFRYFPTREEFLDAIAEEMHLRLELPPLPATLTELRDAPRKLYGAFEAKQSLTRAALHSEIYERMRAAVQRGRGNAIARIIDDMAPARSELERKVATANIRYYLTATTWHYFRFYFDFSLEESIACAETAIRQTLETMEKPAAGD
ncbi:transcriptional regulator, TetR family [Noviherbaspirillum humi]|uniref:Transcriptional regulator, TetR family n=1 Tax=Noviherbaspirillum humi TaxID=1688639 RepID=A0A239BWE0_9BURK|nr:TetR/AcrR family transcriptional regulator [Noviherbaspirillum humi]SNS11748.1 transcriptional regulator, TetR family [Noviherbaspirillum humi]